MIRKTALMAGVAGALFIAAPAFAQDETTAPEMSPSTAPAPASIPQSQSTPAPSTSAEAMAETSAAPAQESLRLTAGSNVTSSDGIVLGQLQGAQTNASGEQELTVKGADGQIRAVPLNGLRQEGEGVVVGWSQAEFNAATPMTPTASDNASNVSGEADEMTPEPTPADPTGENTPPDISGSTTPDMPAQPGSDPMPEEPQS